MIEIFGILLIFLLVLIGIKYTYIITWTGAVIVMLIIVLLIMVIATSQDTY